MFRTSLLAATLLAIHSQPAFASGAVADETVKKSGPAAKVQIAQAQTKIKSPGAETKAADNRGPRAQASKSASSSQPATLRPTWTGLYFGAGISRNRTNVDQGTATQFATNGVASTTDLLSLKKDVFQSGGHLLAGYRWQSGRFISGIEGDYTFDDRASLGPRLFGPEGGSCATGFPGSFSCGTVTPFGQFETLGHLRGLVGFDFSPRMMGYVAAGLAIGRTNDIGSHAGFSLAVAGNQPIFVSANSTSPNKIMLGYSLGLGVEMKTSENVSARFEYLRDMYDGVNTTGAVANGTLGAHTITMTVPGGKAKIVNEAIRGALIYRFDADGSSTEAKDWWKRFTSDPGLTDGSWSGSYAGGGLSQQNYKVTDSAAGASLTINDNTIPGVEYSKRWHPSLSDSGTSPHLLFGYRTQFHRFVGGIEFNYDVDAGKTFFTGAKSPGQFGGLGASTECHEIGTQIACVGFGMQGDGSFRVRSKHQVRFTGGVLITPDILAYAVGGWALGLSPDAIGASSGGIVTGAPAAPIVGAATVLRRGIETKLRGRTFGGGLEIRASEYLSFRGEYTHERYIWNHGPVGTAGFGGTIGDVTVNGSVSISDRQIIKNDSFRFSAIVKLGDLPKP